jgi:hypothetical protein
MKYIFELQSKIQYPENQILSPELQMCFKFYYVFLVLIAEITNILKFQHSIKMYVP